MAMVWKELGASKIEKVTVGTISKKGATSIVLNETYDITSLTDKYSELTTDNFFVEVKSVSGDGGTRVSLGAFSKTYDAETGTLDVSMRVSNTGGSGNSYSCSIGGGVYMVYCP